MTRTPPASQTQKAYASDWAQFARWCRMHGQRPLPPSPERIACYLDDLARPAGHAAALSPASIARRLSGLSWALAQRGFTLDRTAAPIAAVLAAIRDGGRAPAKKTPISATDLQAMVATLPRDLRGLRDRALLLIGFAAGLRRSDIVALEIGGTASLQIRDTGAMVTLPRKTGWEAVEIPRGPNDQTCPVHALEQWLHFARITSGPVFVAVSRDGKRALKSRLNDRHVARLVKETALAAGLRADLPKAERLRLYSGRSLRP